jgi:hypothetical protein
MGFINPEYQEHARGWSYSNHPLFATSQVQRLVKTIEARDNRFADSVQIPLQGQRRERAIEA